MQYVYVYKTGSDSQTGILVSCGVLLQLTWGHKERLWSYLDNKKKYKSINRNMNVEKGKQTAKWHYKCEVGLPQCVTMNNGNRSRPFATISSPIKTKQNM